MRLRTGDVAVVTGAGSGLGLAVARALAGRGCAVALADVRADRLEAATAAFRAVGLAFSVHPTDVTDDAAVHALVAGVREAHGKPAAVLVNCAGVSLAGPFAGTDPDSFDWVMNVNLGGTVRCCRAFLPQFLEAAHGHVVTVGSCFGWFGFPGKSGYCASKFAVRGFSEALRAEVRPRGVGVTVLYPGPVDTNIVRDGRATDPAARDAEAAFLARRGIPAAKVAARLVGGIERDAARVVVGLDYRLGDWLVRLAPTWTLSLIERFAHRFPGGMNREEPAAR